MAFGILFIVGFWGEGQRNREKGFRVGFVDKFDYGERGYGFAFHDCGKNFGMLIIIIIIIIINLINGDVENCRSSKSFGFIYIYRLQSY